MHQMLDDILGSLEHSLVAMLLTAWRAHTGDEQYRLIDRHELGRQRANVADTTPRYVLLAHDVHMARAFADYGRGMWSTSMQAPRQLQALAAEADTG